MHDDRALVEARIERELWERVLPRMYAQRMPLTIEAWDAPGEPVPYEEAVGQDYRPFALGTVWSRPWGTTWFRLRADVPRAWTGKQLEAVIDLGFAGGGPGFQAEGLVWLDGAPLQGVHPRRTAVPLAHVGAGPLTLHVEAASNPAFPGFRPSPLGSPATAGSEPLYRLRTADLAQRDSAVFALLLDAEVLLGTLRALPDADVRRARLLRQLEAAFDLIDVDDLAGTVTTAREVLRPALEVPARASALNVVGVGHAHIDTAWLWPIRETIRKCARTFASALRLIDDYPEYVFVSSQAAQYEWIEQRYPALFERVRDAVEKGRIVPVGGMWVEADMNLAGAESIVRQLVHGQRWFESRFGLRCGEVWIPDVFGYPASLPQVFAGAGCTRFVTQKLSWNKQNRFPHHTFLWEGLDGTTVLTHFPPVDTYNAEVQPEEMAHSERNFRDAGWSSWALMPYGYGNGGGGPTREMLERARRMRDLDGVPRLQLGTVAELFDRVEAEIAAGAAVATWRGELYFETHRGTLTSQSRTKVGNRRCERLLREAELWWAAAGNLPDDVRNELERLWKDVLVQQFHDILPGSSIAWVHADAEAEHLRVGARLEELVRSALRAVSPAGVAVANAATSSRREVVDVDGVATMVEVAGCAIAPVVAVECADRVVTTESSMSNGRVAVRWGADGTITSIIDVERGREILPEGRPISLEIAPDRPVEYDAWDLEAWTSRSATPVPGGEVTVTQDSSLCARAEVIRRVGRSTIRQSWTLRAGSPRLDMTLDVDWHEDEKLLSLMVPLDVRADVATCDIQFGAVRRPTHPSSPWDAAKFEVCAHRYVDVAEPSFGVAVLNDGRYGHRVFDGGVRVSLLRAAKYPDPDADHGRHEVTIALLPHGPGLADVVAAAEALNVPLRVVRDGTAAQAGEPVVSIDAPNVLLSAVKLADDGSDDLVVRMFEAVGDRSAVTVRTPVRLTAATRCNLLEEPLASLDVTDGICVLTLRPFEIVTLRLSTRE